MVEVSNKLVEDVLRNDHSGLDWDARVTQAARSVNSRIISYLKLSPAAIAFEAVQETFAVTATLLGLPGRGIESWFDEMVDPSGMFRRSRPI